MSWQELGVVIGASEAVPSAKPWLPLADATGAVTRVEQRAHRFFCGVAVP